ncbi:RDD family protein [Microvirga sp. 0TCS3.31]
MASVPREARSYQGSSAGVVTRLAAGVVDVLLVAVALAGSYAAWAALRFVLEPREFRMPDPSLLWVVIAFFAYLVPYLTVTWWMAGRSIGDHLWGIRVTTRQGGPLGLVRAFARAVMCAAFPVGLLWCAIDRDRRALHDLVLRTSVIYDWLAHPSARWGTRPAAD